MDKIVGKWHLNGNDELIWNCASESSVKLGCECLGKSVIVLVDGPALTLEATLEIGVLQQDHVILWKDGNILVKQGNIHTK